jgi:hypothetical protein
MAIKETVIRNSKGQPILLNSRERNLANRLAKLSNGLGFEIPMTTLTSISKRVSEQKFFEVAPAKYLPVRVGDGAWSTNITTYRSFDMADEFETGILNTGDNNARQAKADTGVDALTVKVYNWAKEIGWSLMDLQQAARSGNWDLVTSKERSRKKNWDLGIQRIAFLGAQGQNGIQGGCLGLLNQPTVNVNEAIITKKISSMSPEELTTFCAVVFGAYRANCNYTAVPSHFIMPESDYNGLASPASPEFPIKSKLDMLLETFRTITQNPEFKILPLAYADASNHQDVQLISGKQVYTLLNYDEDSVRMDIPVDYTNTLANTINGFSFQNTGYGQFTGVLAYRPAEMLYFQYSA